METHTHILVWAYDNVNTTGNLENVVYIDLIEKDPEKAMVKAKKLIKKNYYRINNISEKHGGKC